MSGRRRTAIRGLMETIEKRSRRADYRIPALWDCWGFEGRRRAVGKEIVVDPAEYLHACLAWIDANSERSGRTAGRSLSRIRHIRATGDGRVRDGGKLRRAGDWIRSQSMYGMMIRTTTAWDHAGDGKLLDRRYRETGTFLKSILLLPSLRRMGITVLYLLPVSKTSRLFRKGELGCPYSAKSFFELDAALGDPLVDADVCGVEDQFALLIDCAHRLGMRVMLDVAPRTAARDSDWILDHPEWFYWIDARAARRYGAPALPHIDYENPIPSRLHEVYENRDVQTYLHLFRFAPNRTDPQPWANFVRRAKAAPPANLLREIGVHFGVTTAPAFSDVINDPQPPWSDVTFLRLFLDHPVASARHLPGAKDQPPYVLFDTIKTSLFPGRRPNRALWNKLADIIPFYQRFGVDGARVDMAHALPPELERMILERARRCDPDFCFCAEDLGTANHRKVRRGGYNIMTGPSWYMQPRGHEGLMHRFAAELPGLKVPVMAAAELPDTPRAVTRQGGKRFSMLAAALNHFLPNAVPMLNSGMEVFERQPMNLGLDVRGPGRRALPANDPQAGRLAFFDRYALHWDNPGAPRIIDLIARSAALRRRFIHALARPRAYFAPPLDMNRRWILAAGFRLPRATGSLLIFANLDCRKPHRIVSPLSRAGRTCPQVLLRIHSSSPPRVRRGKLIATLPPGDVAFILV